MSAKMKIPVVTRTFIHGIYFKREHYFFFNHEFDAGFFRRCSAYPIVIKHVCE